MSANRHKLCSANTSTAPTAPVALQASQGCKWLQSKAEDTVPKCSKTDTTQEENNDEEDSNNDNNNNNKSKKVPVKGRGKGKGLARGKKIRCVAWPSPPAFANHPTHHFIEKLLPSRQPRMRLRTQKACLPISNHKPSSPFLFMFN